MSTTYTTEQIESFGRNFTGKMKRSLLDAALAHFGVLDADIDSKRIKARKLNDRPEPVATTKPRRNRRRNRNNSPTTTTETTTVNDNTRAVGRNRTFCFLGGTERRPKYYHLKASNIRHARSVASSRNLGEYVRKADASDWPGAEIVTVDAFDGEPSTSPRTTTTTTSTPAPTATTTTPALGSGEHTRTVVSLSKLTKRQTTAILALLADDLGLDADALEKWNPVVGEVSVSCTVTAPAAPKKRRNKRRSNKRRNKTESGPALPVLGYYATSEEDEDGDESSFICLSGGKRLSKIASPLKAAALRRIRFDFDDSEGADGAWYIDADAWEDKAQSKLQKLIEGTATLSETEAPE